jgi:hypothetical protein
MQVTVTRNTFKLYPDPTRVIARFFYYTDDRSINIIRRVLAMTEDEVKTALSQVLRNYSTRHRNISKIFEKHFNKLNALFKELNINPDNLDVSRKVVIGSYFTMEYAIESAAFFNPSIV